MEKPYDHWGYKQYSDMIELVFVTSDYENRMDYGPDWADILNKADKFYLRSAVFYFTTVITLYWITK